MATEGIAGTSTSVATNSIRSAATANTALVAQAAVPAAPVNAQAVVPQVNVAAPNKSVDESRGETRWGPLNWLVAGLFACFGWLIVSSFLAVTVGRYLKGRQ